MKVRIVACQQPLHEELSEESLLQIRSWRADFVCLPEHYPLAQDIRDLQEAAARYAERKAYLAFLSEELHAVIVGGTLTEPVDNGYYNTCYVFEGGHEIGFYRKIHPTDREQAAGVLRGDELKVFDLRNLRVGVLICADVLSPRSFEELASRQCQITFIPTASPLREGDTVETKYERDRLIFLEGARIMNCPLVKTCGVGTTFGHPLQGRSLIATPQTIVARAEPHQEDSPLLLFAELEL